MATSSDSEVMKELTLRFGDKEYVVPVLRSIPAAKWREEYFTLNNEVFDAMPAQFEQEHDPKLLAKAIGRGLMGAMLRFPEKLPALIFSYAPSLIEHKEEITAAAYDRDYSRAFAQIWQVAFEPFLGSLGMIMEMQRSQPAASPSLKHVN
ncbi:MAG: hypothetical protein JWQ87_1855 [Candidatus Sulfotelmatobacter sp.]|nr:hypothetical protein [Candidatus Sulfotelmatobacter sp.]